MKLKIGAYTFEQLENFESMEEAIHVIKSLFPDVDQDEIKEKVKWFVNENIHKDVQKKASKGQSGSEQYSEKGAGKISFRKD
ncbi:hypothetical protein GNY06_05075 [Elizabethkingia argentiflava]|uniref:Uncharacterized protein n=1 Tax=Elizabethkingia argenteiflava TaxID=2681556 RepID=A0A845PXG5_9FLAO|nr:hypothetical protein [Elizabethkingia argenteiflava]NAW50780.1 hypothetical protein [Elizabethkingia argenteiflava]